MKTIMQKDYCSCCKEKQANLLKYNTCMHKDKIYIYMYCRECNNKRARKYYKTKAGKEKIVKAIKKSEKKYPEKQEARLKLNYAVRIGKVIKPKNCTKCKKTGRIEAHHNDYSKPLKVKWLCVHCHKIEDKKCG